MRRDVNRPLPGPPDPWSASSMPPFRARPPYLMTEMIAAEPGLAERLVHGLERDDALGDLASAIREATARGEAVIVTGCGTSEHAAVGIAELLTEALRAPVGREPRSVLPLDLVRRPPSRGVVIGVSHEGGTRATVEALRTSREAGARTAIVTVTRRSPGAETADLVLETRELDQSWCHTVGYLSPILAGVVLAERLAGRRPDALALRSLLDVTADPHAPASVAAALGGSDRLLIAGAGVDVVSARELALKVVEGARVPAVATDVETVLHGTLAVATRWTGLVVVATDGAPDLEIVRARTSDVLRAARVLSVPAAGILGEDAARRIPADDTPAGRIVIPRAGRVRGAASALLGATVPLQLLAERLARARGVDPDTIGREDPAQAAAHA